MRAKAYIETRNVALENGESLAADIIRHLYTRQYLGKAVIICDQPISMLSATRKHWLKLSRSLQRQRASTLNADKILKFTHGIAHMQHLRFSPRLPLEQPDTDIFFLRPPDIQVLPVQCFTIYAAASISITQARHMASQLPAEALIVSYANPPNWDNLPLDPKKLLEKRVSQEWQQVQKFLKSYNIDLATFQNNDLRNVEAMDDALDTLLGMSHKFLHIASEFQHALELARPIRIHKTLHEKYDSLILLAHRVQALTPGAFNKQFLQVYNEDDTFFFHDITKEHVLQPSETLHRAFSRHLSAGRKHLAYAIQHAYIGRSLIPSK